MGFTVIVDSCCDLTAAMRAAGHFRVVPLTIRVGEHSFRDDESLSRDALLTAMRACSEAPQTACPSPADYLDAMESADGDIYVVTLSALLSGSHNAAWQAAALFREEHPDRNVAVFNSCSASAGEVLLALKLSELANSGLLFQAVVSQAERFITQMHTLFMLEDLNNLRKSGRLSKAQAALTGKLHLKLLLGASPEGEICRRGQALSIKQGMTKLIQLMCTDLDHQGKTLCIAYCGCRARAEELRLLAMKSCSFQTVLLCPTHGISTVYANEGGIVCAY